MNHSKPNQADHPELQAYYAKLDRWIETSKSKSAARMRRILAEPLTTAIATSSQQVATNLSNRKGALQ